MDADHYKIIQRLKPKENNSRVFFFMEFSRKYPRESVPDPYYGNAEGFKHVLQMIEEGADTFLREMYPSS
jgi:protein-tyrosine phosphatase